MADNTEKPTTAAQPAQGQPSPADALQAQADALKAQIAAAQAALTQVDANGNPTDAALQAQASLGKLQTAYIGILEKQASNARLSQPRPANPKAVNANPNQQYIAVEQPDGTIAYQLNPNYVPPNRIVAGGTTTDKYIITADAQGNLHQSDNPNYNPATQNLDQAKFQWQQAQANIANQLSLGKLSLDQATQQLTAAHDQITAQLTQQTNAVDYAKMLAPDLFSKEGLANFNNSLGSLAKGAGVPFQPVTGIDTSLPVQLAQQALSGQNPQLAASLGQATTPTGAATTAASPTAAKPTSPAPATAAPVAAAPLAKPAVSPVAGAPAGYVAPRLSPTNQAIQAGLGPGSGPASVYAAPGLNPYALGT